MFLSIGVYLPYDIVIKFENVFGRWGDASRGNELLGSMYNAGLQRSPAALFYFKSCFIKVVVSTFSFGTGRT